MTSTPVAAKTRATGRPWPGAVAVLAAAGALWFAWLGWDTAYDVDPETGNLSGPYEWWQVAGLVLSAGGLVLTARRFLPAAALVPAAALGLAGGFAFSARADDSGLAAVGVVMILCGAAAGTAILLALARLLPARPGPGTGTRS
ncbi:hypothetical protein QMA10_07790 [Arthrobacter sp. APC 3897]|uniref:hypothetical protein n=1 Tax=Arthrobacter sp. APC 3897 TaxID=3035204 RepID=UPI0025B2AF32|nr:hypothetical protein [Arthrobacter sp. APC 3897]MDN3481824.1 hypothetical protein [Arthrobacter sp. APC 3897]